MRVVDVWTGRSAQALRTALRQTNESFAHDIGTAVRTVANWNADAGMVPSPDIQSALDTVLARADDDAQARFALLVDDHENSTPGSQAPSGLPNEALKTHELINWYCERSNLSENDATDRLRHAMADLDQGNLRDRERQASRVTQQALAAAVRQLYPEDNGPPHFYRARVDGHSIQTTILTEPDWSQLRVPLTQPLSISLNASNDLGPALDQTSQDAALQRIAEIEVTDARVFNAKLYALHHVKIADQTLTARMGLTDFLTYALTIDVMEAELLDVLARGVMPTMTDLPIRQRTMPTARSITDVSNRVCVGGALALLAVARPAGRRGRQPDYALFVQERSSNVLNSVGKLAVIPKAFHQPLVDFADEAHLMATLERELEEELLGREELELAQTGKPANPQHDSLISEPMRWLLDRGHTGQWRAECTGFGINAIAGNYEFASLIVIDDEEWWTQFGGQLQTNWETSSVRQYSSLDRDGLIQLVTDPRWSNEGLYAFTEGLRRLAHIGGHRIDLPTIATENH